MFLGHFAVALAAKKADNKPSLGISFMAAQWLDLLWPVLLLTGTEKVAINTDSSATIPLSFTHYPVSHSLLAVLGWAVLFATVYFLVKKNWKSALLTGTLVLSHWVLDWLVHIPDLPVTPFAETKTGLGLWNYKYLELAIELMLFAAGVYLYINSTTAINKKGKTIFWSLIIFLVAIHIMNVFGPPPTAVQPIAIVGLSQWLLVLWAWWADRNRV
ncbi:metal-dependent hydrolase [Ferruginibacter profundus]